MLLLMLLSRADLPKQIQLSRVPQNLFLFVELTISHHHVHAMDTAATVVLKRGLLRHWDGSYSDGISVANSSVDVALGQFKDIKINIFIVNIEEDGAIQALVVLSAMNHLLVLVTAGKLRRSIYRCAIVHHLEGLSRRRIDAHIAR